MYLRLCSILHASKDDFELLASKLSVVGCMHPFVGFCTVQGLKPGFCTLSRHSLPTKLHLQSCGLFLRLLYLSKI